MRGKVTTLTAAGGVAVGLTMIFLAGRTHAAQNDKAGAAADECWTGSDQIAGTACEHVFQDGSKCIVFSRLGAPSASLQCKIT
jgi:hypothetical protein